MKKELSVIATLNEPDLLRTVVERLASRHVDQGFGDTVVPGKWKAIETSCIQAYVMGNFDMQNTSGTQEEVVVVPFTGCFLFTCIKGKYDLFNLEWSSSLS